MTGTDPWTTPERLALRETAGAFVRRHVLPGLEDWEAAELAQDLSYNLVKQAYRL